MTRDTLYDKPRSEIEKFAFDEQVAAVFDDMVSRSIPLYWEVQKVSAGVARKFYQPNSLIYDLGCSTGNTILAIIEALGPQGMGSIIGVDSSESLLTVCREKLSSSPEVILLTADLENYLPHRASLIVLNYTLQFIEVQKRPQIIKTLYDSLLPGGAMFVTEKITHENPFVEEILTSLYYDFKREHGYSELEIAQKRDALENVLVPLSLDQNRDMLYRSGFETVEVLLKSYCFASFLGIKR